MLGRCHLKGKKAQWVSFFTIKICLEMKDEFSEAEIFILFCAAEAAYSTVTLSIWLVIYWTLVISIQAPLLFSHLSPTCPMTLGTATQQSEALKKEGLQAG